MRRLTLATLILITFACSAYAVEVDIPDANLERVIRDKLNKPEGPITDAELQSITKLRRASNKDIAELTGLEYCTNLTKLALWDNQIKDITPLSNLTNLTKLSLGDNQITDISPLSGLTNLRGLFLDDNKIADISPLSGLNKLGEVGEWWWLEEREGVKICLGLGNNQIENITPLIDNEGISEGDGIDLRENPLTEQAYEPISVLKDRGVNVLPINVLSIIVAMIVEIPDANLERAIRDELNKPSGPITDAELQSITKLRASKDIADLTGLEYCTNLTRLYLTNNQITDITPLSNLTNLTRLWLERNQITDITPLSNLTNLTELYLWRNQITDISALSNLTNLTRLSLGHNQIKDITPLSNLTNLTELELDINQITDITPLSNLTNLTKLSLGRNQITDISPLPNLTKLGNNLDNRQKVLILSNNQISDLQPLVDNPGINTGNNVDIVGNPLSYTSQKTHIPTLEERGVDVKYFAKGTVSLDSSGPPTWSYTLTYGESSDASWREAYIYNFFYEGAGITGASVTGEAEDSGWTVEFSSTLVTFSNTTPLKSGSVSGFEITGTQGGTAFWLCGRNSGSIKGPSVGEGALTVTPSPVDFDIVKVGVGSDITLSIGNEGTAYLNVKKISSNLSDILEVSETSFTIPPNERHEITLTLTPAHGGKISGTLLIENNDPNSPNKIVKIFAIVQQEGKIPDPNLEEAIRKAIDKPKGPITKTELENLTSLEAPNNNIHDITGIEYCVNLKRLILGGGTPETHWRSNNEIEDISPLECLSKLTVLNLGDNDISDINALSGLTNLKELDLRDNNITDISALSLLTKLQRLNLSANQIKDIQPLVDNSGIDDGDSVILANNPLSYTSQKYHIPALEERGVVVDITPKEQ